MLELEPMTEIRVGLQEADTLKAQNTFLPCCAIRPLVCHWMQMVALAFPH